MFRKGTTVMILALFALTVHAQEVEMADNLRTSGKIYIVVLVVLVILGGLFLGLFRMEKRLRKLEEENKK